MRIRAKSSGPGSRSRRPGAWRLSRNWLWTCGLGLAFAADAAAQPPQAASPPRPVPVLPGDGLPNPKAFDPGLIATRPGLPATGSPGSAPANPVCPPTSAVPGPLLGGTPRRNDPRVAEKQAKYVKDVVDPEATLDVTQGRTRLLRLNQVPKRIQLADDFVAEYNLLAPDQISILGRNVGTTVLTVWFGEENNQKQEVLTYMLRVLPDAEYKTRLQETYNQLAREIMHSFPDSVVHLNLVGDKLVVSGQVRDSVAAAQILKIIRSNAVNPAMNTGHSRAATIPTDRVKASRNPGQTEDDPATPGLENYLIDGSSFIVNLLRIPGEQQVSLRVTVAEVSRAAARSIGVNFSLTNNQGQTYFANATGSISTGSLSPINSFGFGGFGLLGGGNFGTNGFVPAVPGIAVGSGGYNNLPAAIDNGQIALAISALRNLNYARTLAEPNLVALNGVTANFQAGGQFPVPIIAGTGSQGFGLQGVNFVPYGISLSFTPFITDRDLIRLSIAADVSTRDLAAGSVNIGGTGVPNLVTRNFQTVVELREGQTLAVAGLIQNNIAADSRRVPFIGDLPVIGRLASFDRVDAGEQELVVLVTPELVHPLDSKDNHPPLPGSTLFEPNDCEFYLLGRIESHHPFDYRSPIRTDSLRFKQYKQIEQTYIVGPTGHSE